MKYTPTAPLTVTNLAESDDRSETGRDSRTTAAQGPALTVAPLAERDAHSGSGRGVTMYNEAGTADAGSTAAKPR